MGVKCHSAAAAAGTPITTAQQNASTLSMVAAEASARQLEEERRKERPGHVARAELKGCAEAVTVRQENEGEPPLRKFEHQRRVRIGYKPIAPHEPPGPVRLHEPA